MIHDAAFNDHSRIAALLAAARLPVPDLQDQPVHMLAAYQGTELTGCIGFEHYGEFALLRSLAVRADLRQRGLGGQLVAALLARLRSLGVEHVYLLTTDAAGFFARHGFVTTPRTAVPAPVRSSFQFGAGCCSTATCMHRELPATNRERT